MRSAFARQTVSTLRVVFTLMVVFSVVLGGAARAAMAIPQPGSFATQLEQTTDPVQRRVMLLAGLCAPSGEEDPASAGDCPLCVTAGMAPLPSPQDIAFDAPIGERVAFSPQAELSLIRWVAATRSRAPPLVN